MDSVCAMAMDLLLREANAGLLRHQVKDAALFV
jgi:hypothetical protein